MVVATQKANEAVETPVVRQRRRFEADLQSAMDDLKPLGSEMSKKLISALGGKDRIDGYGKGAIVGHRFCDLFASLANKKGTFPGGGGSQTR